MQQNSRKCFIAVAEPSNRLTTLLGECGRVVLACVFLTSFPCGALAQTFKIANWNIRSGEGIHGLTGIRTFDSSTSNCTDRTKPLNAWGVGVPQAELRRLDADPLIVALAVE